PPRAPQSPKPLPGWRRTVELALLAVGGALIIAFFLWLMFLRPPEAYSPATGQLAPTPPAVTARA
ncbi:MAG: hypothetical protein VYB93_02385, partial [Pseudomonadota bacterium]|nr:hypothetical protein [Pseudomonadota bacterium]